jgi:hypothetical protein
MNILWTLYGYWSQATKLSVQVDHLWSEQAKATLEVPIYTSCLPCTLQSIPTEHYALCQHYQRGKGEEFKLLCMSHFIHQALRSLPQLFATL